jgi:hypothetical protein
VFSVLAVLTHSFAVFLVAPEAVWLLYVIRTRQVAIAAGVVAVAQVLLLPLLFTHATSSLLGFISSTRLSGRLQQVPVAFGLGQLWESPLVRYGLLGAALLTAAVIALLLIGSDERQLRGAGAAAALAAIVLFVPLVLALLGEDYYTFRALIPAWIPLAVVVGAACTAPRTRVAGGVLLAVLLASFVYAQVRIESNARYQRPDWRGVARALGPAPSGGRAIVAYDGALASDPLAFYLPRVPWSQGIPSGTTTVSEIDVIGRAWQSVAHPVPPNARLIGTTKKVNDFLVARFAIAPAQHVNATQIAAAAPSLLGPALPSGLVLLQRPS